MATALAILAVVTAISLLTASSDRGLVTSAFAQGVSPKMHLEEGIKSLKSGDNQGALMHLNEANKGLASSSSSSDQTAKIHLDEGIKAVKANDNQGALMHLNAADKALSG